MELKNFIFDMDDTLYPKHLGICASGWKRLYYALTDENKRKEFGINLYSYENFSEKTNECLRQEPNLNREKLMDYVCGQDVSLIPFNPNLQSLLKKLPYKKVLFTGGNDKHIDKVLERLCISNLFDYKLSCFDTNFYFKPEKKAFDILFQKLNISPTESIIFEDSVENIKMAKSYGMKTVLIAEATEAKPEQCDFMFTDIVKALTYFSALK